MADVKVSGLPNDPTVDGDHYVVLNDPTGPTTKRGFLSTLAAWFFDQLNIPDGSGSPRTRDSEMGKGFVVSGGIWSGDAYASTRNASMTALTVYINGRRITISAVSARSFTASRDTYVDVLDNANSTGTLVYTEVTNNAASPALAANSIRIATVVTGASNIAASTSIGQGGFLNTSPVVSSVTLRGADTLGNIIYPKGPVTPVLSQNPAKSSAYRNAAQNSINGFVKVSLDIKTYDTGNNFDLVNSRFVATVAGFYHFSAGVAMGASATPVWQANLYKNGAQHKTGTLVNTNVGFQQSQVSGDIQLAVGEYVELWVYASAAVAIAPGAINTYLDGHMISAS